VPGRGRPSLDEPALREWLAGQRAASERVRSERTRLLASLTPGRSLSLYVSLLEAAAPRSDPSPSPVLWAMRRALGRRRGAPA